MTELTKKGGGPNIPHILKWIKNRTASKKDNGYSSKRSNDSESAIVENATAVLYDKSALITRSSDNIHRISQTPLSPTQQAKLRAHCQAHALKSESMVTLGSPQETEEATNYSCRNGSVRRSSRACMKLPPLPPGHERVLRDLQRQEKKRLRSSISAGYQDNVAGSGNTKLSPLKATSVYLSMPNQPAFTRVQSPLHGYSPEHIYEEIPGSYFRPTPTPNMAAEKVENMQRTNMFHSSYDTRNYSDKKHSVPPQNAERIPNSTLDMNLHANSYHPQTDHKPSSKQVSLGNLNFEMAKECDGFLLVPLRDKTGDTPSPVIQTFNPPNSQNNASFERAVHTEAQGRTTQCLSNPNPAGHAVLPTSQSQHTLSSEVSHSTSDSGYQDQTQLDPKSTCSDSRYRKQSVDVSDECSNADTSMKVTDQQNYQHCSRCGRPHGLYHGVSMCHSNQAEDLRHELQYLDIAGLDRKHRHATPHAVMDSNTEEADSQGIPSFFLNVSHRRSAFSKYIPVRRDGECDVQNEDEVERESIPVRLHPRVHLNSNEHPMGDNTECTNTTSNDAYKRQSMSAESDYFSSNYNTSQSDTTSRGSHGHGSTFGGSAGSANYISSTSVKSNDTFSEYDIAPSEPDVRLVHSETTDDYEYYLAKARQHNRLKSDVKRIIRSSESERSDFERNLPQDDNISLTSVTSLSELSTLPCDDFQIIDRLSCRVHRSVKPHSKHNSQTTLAFHNTDQKTPSPPAHGDQFKSHTHIRKPIRKKRKNNTSNSHNSSKMEYYKLPNFSSSSSFLPGHQSMDNSSHSDTISVGSHGSSGRREVDLDSSCTSHLSKEHILGGPEKNNGDSKLSCRVTDFKLSDITRAGCYCSDMRNAPLSVAKTNTTSGVGNSLASGVSQNNTYAHHGQMNRSSNNRLLNDLMRMNHDRQLFSLL